MTPAYSWSNKHNPHLYMQEILLTCAVKFESAALAIMYVSFTFKEERSMGCIRRIEGEIRIYIHTHTHTQTWVCFDLNEFVYFVFLKLNHVRVTTHAFGHVRSAWSRDVPSHEGRRTQSCPLAQRHTYQFQKIHYTFFSCPCYWKILRLPPAHRVSSMSLSAQMYVRVKSGVHHSCTRRFDK